LPYDVRDSFIQVGLAHALAASGFQTSLILGLVLALSRRLLRIPSWLRSALVIFPWSDWFAASSATSRSYGVWALIALAMRRKVKLLASLNRGNAFTAIPLWIWDLGFQLSLPHWDYW